MNTPTLVYDARDYDRRVTRTDDGKLWLCEATNANGPVLELGVGTGRIAIPLAAAGVDVTGIDISEPMLKRAQSKSRKRNLNLDLIRADMRRFDLARQFGLIYAPLAVINHMPTPDSVLDCLRCVGDHLSPGGHFMIDTFNSSRQQSDPNPPERDGPGVFGTWTPQQLGDLLVNAKYRIVARYGDYDLTPHDPESPRLILKAVAG